eukprot:4357138-Lingulodinium_polyedra.AAC.1
MTSPKNDAADPMPIAQRGLNVRCISVDVQCLITACPISPNDRENFAPGCGTAPPRHTIHLVVQMYEVGGRDFGCTA